MLNPFPPVSAPRAVLVAAVALLAAGVGAQEGGGGMLVNGSFSGSLVPWGLEGMVFNTAEAAALTDAGVGTAALDQSAGVPAGLLGFEIVFDFRNGLSAAVAPGFLPDVFFATVYFGSEPFGAGVFAAAEPLFDLDATGPYNVAEGGTFSPSAKGAEWTRFHLRRILPADLRDAGFLTPRFQIFGINGAAGDSVLVIDDVALHAIVPEPSRSVAAAAVVVGMVAAAVRRRRGGGGEAGGRRSG